MRWEKEMANLLLDQGGRVVWLRIRLGMRRQVLEKKTRVKFMTDGILLQEIRDDLLLRKYGAIVLDEAHERNLNTDVLLGLLSVALPLRRKAAEEGSMPPLKLIVMSATLRVEDFTANPRLFPGSPPAVVTVPGRTFPVTIHHSKVTELDDHGKSYVMCLVLKGTWGIGYNRFSLFCFMNLLQTLSVEKPVLQISES
mmetsp:Transcript_40648/g.61631  ORF Transcript_40648/g.61631 Transcript_40648/m.61631 type:complete len:197 (+) Transcript_40648:70-660(+)